MLLHHRILLRAFLAMLILAGLHFLALTFYFYWQFWWFDIVMHFLGGVVVGLAAMWALLGLSAVRNITFSPPQMLCGVLGAVVIVGLSWEIYELYFGLFDTSSYVADTSLDIVMDLLGAITAFYYVRRLSASAVQS